jgi:glycosyltransferase involved in cell wall biosynthesis
MMSQDNQSSKPLNLVWVFPGINPKGETNVPRLEITRELRNLGLCVKLLTTGPSSVHNILGVEVSTIQIPNKYLIRHIFFNKKVFDILSSGWDTIDIILFQKMAMPLLLLLQIKKKLNKHQRPLLVVDTRSVPMESESKATWKDRLRGSYSNLMNLLANYLADGQTAITIRMAEVVRIPPHKLLGTWPSGVNLERFAPAQISRQWPQDGEPIHLIYVGVLHYERNLIRLCQAVKKANDEGMAFVLSLVGDGTESKDLEKYAQQTDGCIRVIPPIPHDQVPSWLTKAHVGALPFPDELKFHVSSPIKLFEYMGAGLPILATRIVCHTDVIGNGQYTFWADDASVEGLFAALCSIWKQQSSLSKKGNEAALAAKAWSYKESAIKLESALERGILRTSSGSNSQNYNEC